MALADVVNFLNSYQPDALTLFLSVSDNSSHMCHTFISLGKLCKGASSCCGMAGLSSCICFAVQQGNVASCMTSRHRGVFVGVDEGTEEAREVKPSCDSVSKLHSRCCAHLNIDLHYDMVKGLFRKPQRGPRLKLMSVQWLHIHVHSSH